MIEFIKKYLHFFILGPCLMMFCAIFCMCNATFAYWGEYKVADGYDFCFAPKFKVGKTYTFKDVRSDMPDIDDGNLSFTDNYLATTNNTLCIHTDDSKKIPTNPNIWYGEAWGDNGVLSYPKFYTPPLSEPLLQVTRTVDCNVADKCLEQPDWMAGGSENLKNWFADDHGQDAKNTAQSLLNRMSEHIKIWNSANGPSEGHPHHVDEATEFVCYGDHVNEQQCSMLYYLKNKSASFIAQHLQVEWSYQYVAQIDDNDTSDPGGGGSGGVTPGSDGPQGPKQGDPTCESGAGSALGWILCPVLENAGKASQWIYNDILAPALQLNPSLFNTNSGTFNGWEVMRNFANIAFVILFLVVIFSQLTGVGIDNYGIKKILPRLVVAAILINLSYFICQALVDLSNIIGTSVKALLDNLAIDHPNVGVNLVGVQLPDVLTTAGNFVGIGLITGFIAAIGPILAASAGGAPGLLLMGVIIVLVVLLSIFFLFALLAVRQALAVILVVLSPLAFVCYMLPNTKSLFDKWKKALQAMLLLYPIAGLVVGGGNLAARILIGANIDQNWFIALTAMLLSIVPVFCIPLLLKNAFQALGAIGGKLAGMSSLGKVAGRKIRGTEGYKNYMKDSKIRAKARGFGKGGRANKILNSRVGRAFGGDKMIAQAQADLRKLEGDEVEAAKTTLTVDTGNDVGKINANLYDTVSDLNAKVKNGKELDQHDHVRLHAAFATALGKGGNIDNVAAAIYGGDDMHGNTLDGASSKVFNSLTDSINKDSDLATKVNTEMPWLGRYANYRQAGGTDDWKPWCQSSEEKTIQTTAGGKNYNFKLQGGQKATGGLSGKDLIGSKLSKMPEDLRRGISAEHAGEMMRIDAKQNPDWQANQATMLEWAKAGQLNGKAAAEVLKYTPTSSS